MRDGEEVRPATEVAVAVLTHPVTGEVLLGSRPAGKPYAGWWELPGGKLEAGESVHEALVRELREELGLTVLSSTPWFVLEKSYPHAYVRLHFRRSSQFEGEPKALEQQEFRWIDPGSREALKLPLLPMVSLVLRRLTLPDVLLSAESEEGVKRAALLARRHPGTRLWVRTDEEQRTAQRVGIPFFRWDGTPLVGGGEANFLEESEALFALSVRDDVTLRHANRLPVYVPGEPDDLQRVRRAGAHGVYLRFF